MRFLHKKDGVYTYEFQTSEDVVGASSVTEKRQVKGNSQQAYTLLYSRTAFAGAMKIIWEFLKIDASNEDLKVGLHIDLEKDGTHHASFKGTFSGTISKSEPSQENP